MSNTFKHGADFPAFQLDRFLCLCARSVWFDDGTSLGMLNHQSEESRKNCDETNQLARQRKHHHFVAPSKTKISYGSRNLKKLNLYWGQPAAVWKEISTRTLLFLILFLSFSLSLQLNDCTPKNGLSEFPFYSDRWGLSFLNIFGGVTFYVTANSQKKMLPQFENAIKNENSNQLADITGSNWRAKDSPGSASVSSPVFSLKFLAQMVTYFLA